MESCKKVKQRRCLERQTNLKALQDQFCILSRHIYFRTRLSIKHHINHQCKAHLWPLAHNVKYLINSFWATSQSGMVPEHPFVSALVANADIVHCWSHRLWSILQVDAVNMTHSSGASKSWLSAWIFLKRLDLPSGIAGLMTLVATVLRAWICSTTVPAALLLSISTRQSPSTLMSLQSLQLSSHSLR